MNGKSNNSLINNDSNKQIAKPIIPPPTANPTLSSQMETGDGNVALDLVVVIDTS
ncbi:VWA domain-containing protein, partial [Proteus mirabilis]|nr:VWA domain-containing protein [Proteus mirabilis]